MIGSAVLNPLTDPAGSAIADWLELAILSSSRRRLSPGKSREILVGCGSATDEVDVAIAFGTLNDRCAKRFSLYPFLFSRLGLERRNDSDSVAYSFLLLLASITNGSVHVPDPAVGARLFERAVRHAAEGLWGPRGRAVRFGHPPDVDRPTSFTEAVAWLGAKVRAKPLPLSGATMRRSDGGVDVVAWVDHEDTMTCGPIAAIQATFDSDLRGKSLEIAGNELNRWLAIAPALPVLASPFDGPADPDLFSELCGRVLTLDRWRLLTCLSDWTPDDEIRGWTLARLNQLIV